MYDAQRGSWPLSRPEFGKVAQSLDSEAAAQVEADRLNEAWHRD